MVVMVMMMRDRVHQKEVMCTITLPQVVVNIMKFVVVIVCRAITP
jgi:hypothetical protein